MNDQAASLRKRVQTTGNEKRAKVISIVSGKGGVGKSNISLNLALSLTKFNKKVLIIDLDVGMANIDILMGSQSHYHIVDMIENRLSIWDIIETNEYNLSFIAGGNGLSDIFELTDEKFNFFINQLEQVISYFDYIFFDIGAGASKGNLKFVLASDEVTVVTTTEPTALTDAYAMIKHINQYQPDIELYVIINRCGNSNEGKEIANRLVYTVRHFLDKTIQVKGYIPDDSTVSNAVKKQIPLLLFAPKAKASSAIQNVALTYIKDSITKKSRPHNVVQALKQMFKKDRK
jgi:flagellar biosynthesis protein FlhG